MCKNWGNFTFIHVGFKPKLPVLKAQCDVGQISLSEYIKQAEALRYVDEPNDHEQWSDTDSVHERSILRRPAEGRDVRGER